MEGIPAATPLTTPDVPTVASPVLLLVHVPPAGDELNEVVDPVQTKKVPVSADGCVFTVTGWVVKHPVPKV